MEKTSIFLEDLKAKLQQKRKSNLYRRIENFDRISATKILHRKKILTCFASNDYLGLSFHPKVKKAAIKAVEKFGSGSGSSRLICGNNSLYKKLENELAGANQTGDSIIFSSGFACAISIIPTLVSKSDLIIADRLIHASLIDGSLASNAQFLRFAHNDLKHCRQLLLQNRKNYRNCLIITETVFSMDGDLAPISDLLCLAKEFECLLLTDNAHGIAFKNILSTDFNGWIKMGTLSKAVGSLGGYVCGSREVIDYLRNFSRGLIYSTALPAACLSSALVAVKVMKNQRLANKVMENTRYFCELMNLKEPQSSIVPLIIGDNKKVLKISELAKKSGFLISAIRPPTVPEGSSRLRISFCALHQRSDIKNLAKFLKPLV